MNQHVPLVPRQDREVSDLADAYFIAFHDDFGARVTGRAKRRSDLRHWIPPPFLSMWGQTAVLPTPGAYLLAGVVYGLVPMAIGAALQARRAKAPSLIGAFEAWLVFLVVLLPYAAVRCGEFPLALLVGFLAGIAAGGLAGGAAGIGLARRPVWV